MMNTIKVGEIFCAILLKIIVMPSLCVSMDLIKNYPDDIQKHLHYSNNRERTMTDYVFDSVSIGKYICETDIWVDSLTKKLYSLKSYVESDFCTQCVEYNKSIFCFDW